MSYWRHLEDRTPKAGKPHQCELCYEMIAVGEVYRRRTGLLEGSLLSFVMHEECHQVTVDNKWDEDHWEYFDSSEFREELAEWREAKKAATP